MNLCEVISMIDILSFYIVVLLGVFLFLKFRKRKQTTEPQPSSNSKFTYVKTYTKKSFMSNYEKNFYKKLSLLNDEYIVIPQVNLASIIEKRSNVRFHNELFRNIDFGIFDKETMEILLLIEVNDRTHVYSSRKKRDRSVREICLNADIPLITFYTTYPNETDYVLNRIRKEIHSRQENQETHQTTV